MGGWFPSCNGRNMTHTATTQTNNLKEDLNSRDNLIQMDQHKPLQYHLSSKAEHNAALSHWLVLHSLPRGNAEALITTLCFVSMVLGIESPWWT